MPSLFGSNSARALQLVRTHLHVMSSQIVFVVEMSSLRAQADFISGLRVDSTLPKRIAIFELLFASVVLKSSISIYRLMSFKLIFAPNAPYKASYLAVLHTVCD